MAPTALTLISVDVLCRVQALFEFCKSDSLQEELDHCNFCVIFVLVICTTLECTKCEGHTGRTGVHVCGLCQPCLKAFHWGFLVVCLYVCLGMASLNFIKYLHSFLSLQAMLYMLCLIICTDIDQHK